MQAAVQEFDTAFAAGCGSLADVVASGTTFVEEVLDAIPEAVAITRANLVVHVNVEFCRLFGYKALDCVGQDLDDLVMPDGRLHESEILLHGVGTTGRSMIETVRKTAAGTLIEVAVLASRVRLPDAATGLFILYRDISRQKREAARLQHTALHDGLTGLPNRALFLDRVRLTLARFRRRPDRGFAVVFLDLDGFKRVNDTLGHGAGDEVLMEIGRRLRRCVRPQDTVARFGGDEFALLLDETASGTEAMQVAERIGADLRCPMLLAGVRASVGASMGIVVVTGEYTEAEEIMRHADLAMYGAKQGGKSRCVLWGRT